MGLVELNFNHRVIKWSDIREDLNINWLEVLGNRSAEDMLTCTEICKTRVPPKRGSVIRKIIPRDRHIHMRERSNYKAKLDRSPPTAKISQARVLMT